MIREDALASLRRHVGDAFKAGTSTFPHFTLHGTEHLEELDRLALLVGKSIPALSSERLNLLRLALILHDFAMVSVPNPAREEELRQRMTSDLTFADLVREVHQDEIEQAFTQPDQIAFLAGLFPEQVPHGLEDACTIARHHRLHPLRQAPEHVRDLCALMRILDELDIGSRRAPLPVYQALRERMNDTSHFHWLKHICTRPVERYSTFSHEEPNAGRRVLKALVAVKADGRTWKGIQEKIISKIVQCIDNESVNSVLREMLQVEFAIEPAEHLSGSTPYLPPYILKDLDSLPDKLWLPKPKNLSPAPTTPAPLVKPRPAVALRTVHEFKIVAIPPESLPAYLCLSGRLTVIDNTYIAPREDTVGGVTGAPNRIYIGPADSGKTRAATEWIGNLTKGAANQWVVLRTDMGTLPERADDIVLDTSRFSEGVPQRAILFLDDLPLNLPPAGSPFSATDAVRVLFQWFQETYQFRERRVVGTIRLEDLHAHPGWPDVLPSLDQEMALIRLQTLDRNQYRSLWEGMVSGATSQSRTTGVQPFYISIEEGFLEGVKNREADPEAVATFVNQSVSKALETLTAEDAKRFSENAADTWLRETWPAVRDAYGLAAKVFFTLARYLEAGRRIGGGTSLSLAPAWHYHKVFGPELCQLSGGIAESYLPTLRRLLADGHAAGVHDKWIRPKFDFLLQAGQLQGAELELPAWSWFAERAGQLDSPYRVLLADYLASSGNNPETVRLEDSAWQLGCGVGIAFQQVTKPEETELEGRLTAALNRAVEVDPKNSLAWLLLGAALGQKADHETDTDRKDELRQAAIDAYRNAVQADPKNSQAWLALGFRLGQKANHETEDEMKFELREAEIDAYRNAVQSDPKNSQAWNNLGVSLGQKADHETEDDRKHELREAAIDAYRNAVQADPKNSQAWNNLGVSLGQKADHETEDDRKLELREAAIDAYRNAVQADPKNSQAWNNLGVRLGKKADHETEDGRKLELREAAIDAYRNAVQADPKNSQVWNNLGIGLGKKADHETEDDRKLELREAEIDAYRNAVQADPKYSQAWNNLGISLEQKADHETEGDRKHELREATIDAYRNAVQADPKDSQAWYSLAAALLKQSHEKGAPQVIPEALHAARTAADLGEDRYNLACALALSSQVDEAFRELKGALARGEISREHVAADPDWESLREDPRFRAILGMDNP